MYEVWISAVPHSDPPNDNADPQNVKLRTYCNRADAEEYAIDLATRMYPGFPPSWDDDKHDLLHTGDGNVHFEILINIQEAP